MNLMVYNYKYFVINKMRHTKIMSVVYYNKYMYIEKDNYKNYK